MMVELGIAGLDTAETAYSTTAMPVSRPIP
jgi:hypothetical protein